MSLRIAPLLLALLAVSSGCAIPVRVEPLEAGRTYPVRRIALMPVEVAPGLPGARAVDPDASGVVGSRLVEALTLWTGIPFVPPDSVKTWRIADRDAASRKCDAASPHACDVALAAAFNVDALLFTRVRRYQKLEGTAGGARRPASVWFDLELRSPAGLVLWRGTYDEIQHSLSEDLGSLPRFYQRGFRWVSAETLASYGAKELALRLDAEVRRWR